MADNKITVEIELDDKGTAKGFKAVEEQAKSSFSEIAKGVFVGQLAVDAFKKALSGAVGIISDSVKEAAKFEESVNALNVALASGGQFSKEVSEGFQAFAQSIQETTKFSDDQVLSSAALLANMTELSNVGLKQATQAALDLSAAYNIDLETATRMIGKAAEGNVSSFGRLGIEIRKGDTDAKTFANTLDELSRISGASARTANTYQGAITQLGNSFGDLLKNIGKNITQSPAIIATFKEISKLFGGLSSLLGDNKTDFFKSFIINMSVIAQAGIQSALDIKNAFVIGFLEAERAWLAFKVLTTAGLSTAFNQQLLDANDKLVNLKNEIAKPNPLNPFFDNLIMKVSETSGALKGLADGVTNLPTDTAPALEAFSFNLEVLKSVSIDVSQQMKQGLANAASQGIQAFVKATMQGKNAFAAFGKAIFSTMADMAIQIGTTLLAAGIGLTALAKLEGPKAIIAGAALIAIGAIMKSLSGGESGAGAAGGGGSASAASSSEKTSFNEPTDIQQKQTAVVVNIQGNVLDRRETGLEIVSILNEAFDAQGTAVMARA